LWKGKETPEVIVTNGPGTAVIVVLALYIYKFFGMYGTSRTRMIYVESFARVRTLSLSGKLLLPLVHRFLVQWEGLWEDWKEWGVEYVGFLVS